MLRTIAVLVVAVLATSGQIGQQFPYTSKNGRATVVYRHDGLTLVANYDYSQRHHDGPWLLVDVALGSDTRFVLHRNQFSLVTAAGRTIALASQQQGEADPNGINMLIQNARIQRRDLSGFFPQRHTQEAIRFFSLPFNRSISDEAVVDNNRVTAGPLLFRSPDGTWTEGTYRLALEHTRATAAVPISLQ